MTTNDPPEDGPHSDRAQDRSRLIATYRLQLSPRFPLASAQQVLPYLRDLGISHVYLSPCLTATPGSEHGYDVADPTTIDEELGGEDAFAEFSSAARDLGLQIVLDIVPNHMTTHGSNRYFQDVLAHGRASMHAPKFDLYDLEATGEPIVIGTLGQPYGDALEKGEISVHLEESTFSVRYFEHAFPTAPRSWALLVGANDGPIFSLCQELDELETRPRAELVEARMKYSAKTSELEDLLREHLAQNRDEVTRIIADINRDPGRLHEFLELQHFRLMWWKLEGEFVNYRRFFNIGTLVGVRMEDPEVFDWAHSRIRRLVTDGHICALRVDHPDGLRNPRKYFEDLRKVLPDGRIYVEKILDGDETLPDDWPVDGTVGYDFLNRVNRLWMDETQAETLTSIYADFTGHETNYLALVREQKHAILARHFRGDLLRLTRLAVRVADEDYRTRDVSLLDLERAIAHTIVALPIYRTYLEGEKNNPADAKVLSDALSLARSWVQPLTASQMRAFEFVEGALLAPSPTAAQREFLARFQQLAPAVMAKGVEDTSFYRFDRLVSCNEVGATPSALGISAEHFHEYLSHLDRSWQSTLLTTSTHDTKRSEDVRARINLLSEIPETWHARVLHWAQHNFPAWSGRQPDRHAEYLLYQTLVGAHPLPAERAFAYVQKAVREAKIFTSWHEPNETYEKKLDEFIRAILSDDEFCASLSEFCERLIHPGRVNSLAQTLIKLTAPGVPDFYQGTELWDLSLVDPDNRRPVDFESRFRMLDEVRVLSVDDLNPHWDSGLVKLWMIDRVLSLRNEAPHLFSKDHRPLIARGEKLRHVLAYTRGQHLAVVVPRFAMSIGGDFGETELELPPGEFECLFSRQVFFDMVPIAQILERFPVALLVRRDAK